jgi:uncharacterized membrane protein YgcG
MGLVSRISPALGKRDFIKDLNSPLLRLSRFRDDFTLEDAVKGVHVFGGIGSGKSSGSGRMLAGAYLRAGMGGLVTCVKPDEVALWRGYAAAHGRDFSVSEVGEGEGFNFLTYALAKQGGSEGILSVVEALMHVLEAAKRASATASQRGEEPFWEGSTRMLLTYSILPLYAASGTVTISDIIRFVSSAPASLKDVTDRAWQDSSFLYKVMNAAANRPKVPIARREMEQTMDYWSKRWLASPEKTRGNMQATIDAVLDKFLHGRLQRVFCSHTSVVPEMAFSGSVLLVNMPTTTWGFDGIIGNVLLKYFFQNAVVSRNSLAKNFKERPVFLWSDEAQETVHSSDGDFISIARSSKCCPVYLSQTLPGYVAKIGGDNPREAAEGLVGKFQTQIFHTNACPTTNEWASKVIGKVVKRHGNASTGRATNFNDGINSGWSENSGTSSNHSFSTSSSGGNGSHSSSFGGGSSSGTGSTWSVNRGRGRSYNESQGFSESMEYAVEPGDFARTLQTGGPSNGGLVTGVWFQSGRRFRASGHNVLLGRFAQ